jgi:uncharacterized protein YraI
MKRVLWLTLALLLVACGGSPATPTLDVASRDATSIARQVATFKARDASDALATATYSVVSTPVATTQVVSATSTVSNADPITPTSQPGPSAAPQPTATSSDPLAHLRPDYEQANVRSGPSTDYPIQGPLQPSVSVRVTGRNENCADSACTWWQIDYNNAPGWVSGQLVETTGDTAKVQPQQVAPAPTATPDPQPRVLAKAGYDYVNVRSGPARSYDVIGRLQPNTPARVTGKSTDGTWWQIDYDGASRWIDGNFVDLRGDASAVTVAAAPAQPAPAAAQAAPAQSVPAQSAPTPVPVAQAAAPAAPAAAPQSSDGCPTTSNASFELIPRDGPASDRPDRLHGDLNLGLRGYGPAAPDAPATLMSYNGGADSNAPQFSGLFQPNRIANIQSVYRVNLWYFESDKCNGAPYGCAGPAVTNWPVTMIGMATTPGERISIPSRGPLIWTGYQALVLYADTKRITINYTRQDNISYGYVVYIENVCVDPNLLALYRAQNDANGWRSSNMLPALRNGQPLGSAAGNEIRVAIRDSATFLDPRSRKDWWQH